MQNVVNTLQQFFIDGKPIVGGRVHFVSLNSDSEYIPIYDANGTPLKNPLGLNAQGVYETQPFVADGMDFKGIVEEPTGLPPLYEDDSPCWRKVYEFVSMSGQVSYDFDGVSSIDNMEALRNADPKQEVVLVLGYYSKDDLCPPRIYHWNSTIAGGWDTGRFIKSNVAEIGAWELKCGPFVDVRWFGTGLDVECAQRLRDAESMALNLGIPLSFPAGYYKIGSSVSLSRVMLGSRAVIQCHEDVSEVTLFIRELLHVGLGGGVITNAEEANNRLYLSLGSGTYNTMWLSDIKTNFGLKTYLSRDDYSACKNCDKLTLSPNHGTGTEIAEALRNVPSNKVQRVIYMGNLGLVQEWLGIYRPDELKTPKAVITDAEITNGLKAKNFEATNARTEELTGNKAEFYNGKFTKLEADEMTAQTFNGKLKGTIETENISVKTLTANRVMLENVEEAVLDVSNNETSLKVNKAEIKDLLNVTCAQINLLVVKPQSVFDSENPVSFVYARNDGNANLTLELSIAGVYSVGSILIIANYGYSAVTIKQVSGVSIKNKGTCILIGISTSGGAITDMWLPLPRYEET